MSMGIDQSPLPSSEEQAQITRVEYHVQLSCKLNAQFVELVALGVESNLLDAIRVELAALTCDLDGRVRKGEKGLPTDVCIRWLGLCIDIQTCNSEMRRAVRIREEAEVEALDLEADRIRARVDAELARMPIRDTGKPSQTSPVRLPRRRGHTSRDLLGRVNQL